MEKQNRITANMMHLKKESRDARQLIIGENSPSLDIEARIATRQWNNRNIPSDLGKTDAETQGENQAH